MTGQGRAGGRARLLVATTNPGKVRELVDLLQGLPVDVVAPAGAVSGPIPDVEETGTTFLDNALLKARAYAAWSGLAALAEDSGLEVDALGGAPGVYSARYAGASGGGHDAADQANNAKLLAELTGVPPERRTARYHCAAVLTDPSGGEWHATGTWEGRVLTSPRGRGGFGYDPLFLPEGWDRTAAEVDAATKNATSHRARALAALRPAIETWARAAPR